MGSIWCDRRITSKITTIVSRTEIQDADRKEIADFVERHWYSTVVVNRGRRFYPHEEQGFVERRDGEIVGLLTNHLEGRLMEILTLNSTLARTGIGSSLMLSAIETARKRGCTRVVLATTNDNLRAIGFYQRLGFRMVAINVGAVDEARKMKPQIPKLGERDVPIRDEIIMELPIEPYLDE